MYKFPEVSIKKKIYLLHLWNLILPSPAKFLASGFSFTSDKKII